LLKTCECIFSKKSLGRHNWLGDGRLYTQGGCGSWHIIRSQKGLQMLDIISQNQTFIFLLPFKPK
jgi:hypothetical protein